MNHYQRAWKLFGTCKQYVTSTVRSIAEQTNIPKSSVHRHRVSFLKRQQHPESHFWETEEGIKWLNRLVIASIYHFGLNGSVGSPTLHNFFEQIHITTHLGLSESSIDRIRECLIEEINQYGKTQTERCKKIGSSVTSVLGADETWLEHMILILMDLPSGFIFMEKAASKRDFATWSAEVSTALSGFSLNILYMVSDRAKSLIKLAKEHFNCPSDADLFHVLNDINKEFALSIHWRQETALKNLQEAELLLEKSRTRHSVEKNRKTVESLKEKWNKIKSVKSAWLQTLKKSSLSIHPFDSEKQCTQTSNDAVTKFTDTIQSFERKVKDNDIPERKKTFSKVKNQINDVCQPIDIWWKKVDSSLDSLNLNNADKQFIKSSLLPYVYWGDQRKKTRSSEDKELYKNLESSAYSLWNSSESDHLSKLNNKDQWLIWAKNQIKFFQRTSSAVEGRNGFLSIDYKNKRHLNERNLKALTVIHNFDIRRDDHLTPAERLFGLEFPDLFESIFTNMNQLPRPRKRKTQSAREPAMILAVPL